LHPVARRRTFEQESRHQRLSSLVPAISTPQQCLSSGCDRCRRALGPIIQHLFRWYGVKRSISLPRGSRTSATFGALAVALLRVMRPPCWSPSPVRNVAIAVSSRRICCRIRSHVRAVVIVRSSSAVRKSVPG
jgi:hypothetical protein